MLRRLNGDWCFRGPLLFFAALTTVPENSCPRIISWSACPKSALADVVIRGADRDRGDGEEELMVQRLRSGFSTMRITQA